MGHWVVFDHESLDVVVGAGAETAELRGGRDALGGALAGRSGGVVLLPSPGSGQVIVACIRRARAATVPPRTPVYEATGFLGLSDEAVSEDNPAPPKKWWRKLLG